ncbi:DUF2461 domain-containing protein [Elongatibacter sediminis]|uniref:DUF2461 domain-containing protein n=1 Tax=Elongatibacter sediminis TaxID=3119006 RepID=A0AAW9RHA6_9GAMM
MTEFSGFPADLFRFLEDLRANNSRDWFNDHKARYLESVVEPMSAFIVAMQPRLRSISKHYRANPKPHGGSMFRIYRDTRFSKDKTPYKTHAACQFRHERGRSVHAPGFYVHLEPEGLHFGGGIWRPPGPQLTAIRDFIADNARSWARIKNAKKVREVGGIRGESLKRPPRGFNAEHVHIEDLKRKSFYVMSEAEPEAALSADFPDTVTQGFQRAAPLTRFVCDALELEY